MSANIRPDRPDRTLSLKAALIPACLLVAGGPLAAEAAEVSRSVTVSASPAEVWAVIGPFCSIADWYPGIDTCKEEMIGGKMHRRLDTADGGQFLEQLLDRNDAGMTYSYAIIEGPLPVANYSSTLSVAKSGGDTVITWKSGFDPAGATEEKAVEVLTGVYDGGLEALRARFAK